MKAFKCFVLLLILAIAVQATLAQRARVIGTARSSNYGYDKGSYEYLRNTVYMSDGYDTNGIKGLNSNGYYASNSNVYSRDHRESKNVFCKWLDQTSYGTCYCCLGGCSGDMSPQPQYDDCDRDSGWWSCCSD